jgi:MPBQ/MSBQ methyltransferase
VRGNPLSFLFRLLLGTAAGAYYFILPIYMYLKHLVWPKDKPM